MKKIILSILAVAAFGTANAQEEESTFGFGEGDIFVEGNIGFNSSNDKNTDTKTNSFNFNPKVGYFISEDLAIGLELGFSSGKTKVGGQDTNKSSSVGIGAFMRYYFLDLGQRFKTYGEFGAAYGTNKNGLSPNEVKTNGFGVGAGLGINYFATENIAINFGLANILSYSSRKADVSGAKAENQFNFGFGEFNNFFDTARFGITYKF